MKSSLRIRALVAVSTQFVPGGDQPDHAGTPSCDGVEPGACDIGGTASSLEENVRHGGIARTRNASDSSVEPGAHFGVGPWALSRCRLPPRASSSASCTVVTDGATDEPALRGAGPATDAARGDTLAHAALGA